MSHHICTFIGVPDEAATLKPGEFSFTCTHGVTLSRKTARKYLGLPPIREDQKFEEPEE